MNELLNRKRIDRRIESLVYKRSCPFDPMGWKKMEQLQHVSVEDIKKNPELIAQLLLEERDVSILFEKRGDEVRYAYLKPHKKKSVEILQRAKDEHRRLKEKGYTREQAFKDFEEAREEMSKYL